jgi:hypothetical protein
MDSLGLIEIAPDYIFVLACEASPENF